MWTFPDHSGNSTTQQRIALMQRYLARFNASTVRMLLADREFIGQEWNKHLKDKGIPFAIRVKEDQLIVVEGRAYSLRSCLSRCNGERGFTASLPAKATGPRTPLRRKAYQRWRAADRRLFRAASWVAHPAIRPMAPVHRMHVCRQQDHGVEPRRYRTETLPKVEPFAGNLRHRSGHGLSHDFLPHGGKISRMGKAWLLLKVVVPHRFRRTAPTPADKRQPSDHRQQIRHQETLSTGSRVVCVQTRQPDQMAGVSWSSHGTISCRAPRGSRRSCRTRRRRSHRHPP